MSTGYGTFRNRLLQRLRTEGMTPTQVADALQAEGLGAFCRDEINQYRIWEDRWGGPIPDGRAWWNRRTSSLEPWPHAAVEPATPTITPPDDPDTAPDPFAPPGASLEV